MCKCLSNSIVARPVNARKRLKSSRKLSSIVARAEPEQNDNTKQQAQILRVFYEADSLEDTLANNDNKPLKINRDLLLWRSRQLRKKFKECADQAKKWQYLDEAESLARRVMEMDAFDPRSYVTLGNILRLKGSTEDAIKVYEKGCLVTEGKNAFIWSSWAYLEWLRGNINLARKYYEAASTADSAHGAAWHGWSLLEKGQGNFLRARNLLQKGIKESKEARRTCSPYLYQSMGVLAFEMELFEEARKWLQEGIRAGKSAQSVAMWHTWALLEAQLGNDSLANRIFQQALAVTKRSRYVLLSWGLWYYQRGDIESAREIYRRGCMLNLADVPLLQAWAMLEATAGDIENARIIFKRASYIEPYHIPVWQAWGLLEFRQGLIQDGRQYFRNAVERAKKDQDLVFSYQAWGHLEGKIGNYQVARDLFKCALRIDPQNNPTYESWIQMEEELGLLNRAQEVRLLRTQQRVDVVKTRNFTTRPQSQLQPVIDRISNWFNPNAQTGEEYGDQQAENDILNELMSPIDELPDQEE